MNFILFNVRYYMLLQHPKNSIVLEMKNQKFLSDFLSYLRISIDSGLMVSLIIFFIMNGITNYENYSIF